MTDYWGTINSYRDQVRRSSKPITKPSAKLISLGSGELYTKSNYQDFQRFVDTDLVLAGDGEATMPMLVEAVQKHIDRGRKSAFEARGKKLAEMHSGDFQRGRSDVTHGWDASPVSPPRPCAEGWNRIKDRDR